MKRRALLLRTTAIVLLLALAWIGLVGGARQLSISRSSGERWQTATQFVYGALALLSIGTVFRAGRLTPWIHSGFAVSAGLSAGLASVVWGDTSTTIGLGTGAVVCAAGLGVAWMLRRGSAPP